MNESFQPSHGFFVGVDSDGCAFDTMEVKHKECFIPNIIEYFNLAPVSRYARECAEFVNLYSHWRGINRFPALTTTLDLLAKRPEVVNRRVSLPTLSATRNWIETETKLGNPALAEAAKVGNDSELANLLAWSKAVNDAVGRIVRGVPPFPWVRETLARLSKQTDVFVCSATPNEALKREWEEHELHLFVDRICGQEIGTKKEILSIAHKYPAKQCLMIGDAPGDLAAAQANNVLFFPINPGHEEASWQRLHDEGVDRFLSGEFNGEYEADLIRDFEQYLPAVVPWKTIVE